MIKQKIENWGSDIVSESLKEYYEGYDHYEVCHNVFHGIPKWKRYTLMFLLGKAWLNEEVDLAVQDKTDDLCQDQVERSIEGAY
tara:strand:- start:459 stop:710 length:252 start_codon:yes stop_codon:yes gene_type:complete